MAELTVHEACGILFKGQSNIAQMAKRVDLTLIEMQEAFNDYVSRTAIDPDVWKGDIESPGPIQDAEMRYQTDWRDGLRHFSNLAFVCSYLFFERSMTLQGALSTIVGEVLLAPSALKQRSWSTVIVGSVFLALAVGTVSRSLFG